ncbi:hypothetical protein Tco_1522054 [Tanacetum coccineum]
MSLNNDLRGHKDLHIALSDRHPTYQETTSDQIRLIRARITCIIVNGKRAYELKGRFFVDLRNNAFSGTNGEDAVKHIEYFLKISDPINLPNVNYERLKLVIIFVNLSDSRMGKLSGPPAVQMKMDFAMVENYREWFESAI